MARPPRRIEKLSQERKVRSLAKKTLGSTRTGRAMRLVGGGEIGSRFGSFWGESTDQSTFVSVSGGISLREWL